MALLRNKLFSTIGIYGITNVLNAGIPFFLLPVLTHYLTPKDFAIIALFQALTNFLMPFIGLNFTSAISVNYFYREKIKFNEYVFNGVILLFLSTLTLLFFLLIFKNQIATFLSFPEPWLLWVILYVFFFKITDLILVIWRVQSKAIPFGVLKIAVTIVELALSIFLIVSLKYHWEGRIIAIIVSCFVFSIVSSFILFRKDLLSFKVNKEYIKDILKFGVPLIPHSLGFVLIIFSDRIFIVKMVGEEALGLYSVGYQIGMVISLIQNSFNQAWTPYFYGKLKENNKQVKVNIVKFTYAYFLFMILLVVILYFSIDFIFKYFIGGNFEEASIYVIWIAVAFAINGMYKIVVNYFFYMKKTVLVSSITFLAALINLCLNYFLILRFGAIGAAQAAVIAFAIQFILIWIVSTKVYPMPWLFFLKNK